MASFSINQRIKKVRGRHANNIGNTGVFLGPAHPKAPVPYDGMVSMDQDGINSNPEYPAVHIPAGIPTNIVCDEWEPIIPKHEPGSWEEIQKLMAGEEEVQPA